MKKTVLYKKLSANRAVTVSLSILVLLVLGFALKLTLPAVIVSALLFASSYLVRN